MKHFFIYLITTLILTGILPDNGKCGIPVHVCCVTCGATLIELSSFTAIDYKGKVVLEWATKSEISNAGFYLWRSKTENGDYIQINEDLIPAEGDEITGHSYTYVDQNAEIGVTYFYKLEDIDLNGNSTFHEPVGLEWVKCLESLSPEDGAQISLKMRPWPIFSWDNGICSPQRIEFASTPEFSKGLSFFVAGNVESWYPHRKQWNKIRRLGRKANPIYWQVVGSDDTEEIAYSPVFSFTLKHHLRPNNRTSKLRKKKK